MGRRRSEGARREARGARREARERTFERTFERMCINVMDALLFIRAEDETGWMRFEGEAPRRMF